MTEERKWHKGRVIADILRRTEGRRGQRRGEEPYLVQAGHQAESCHDTIKDTDRQSSMLLGRDQGEGRKPHGKPTVVLYLHVRSACLLSFLKLFHTTRGSGTKDRL